MAITMDWNLKRVTIEKEDMDLIMSTPCVIYELDINDLRKALKSIEDSEDGIVFDDTHNHNTEVELGGVTYARMVEIINGYSIIFEDDQYAVNLVGANSNIADNTCVNSVSLRSFNAAGLIVVTSGSGVLASDIEDIADAVWDEAHADHKTAGSTADTLRKIQWRAT